MLSEIPNIILAPFKGITTKAYRNAFSQHFSGIDQMYAPFISGVGDIRINPSKLQDIIPVSENRSPTIPQFISTNAREVILLGQTLKDCGYHQMNWNLGCPFSRIAEKHRGCGILPYPDMLDSLLDRICSNITIRLSIKTRLGYVNSDEIYAILEVLNNYPIHSVIIHARTGKQVYGGETDPEAFGRCLDMSRHPMVYNGDMYNLPGYLNMKTKFPQLTTWMLGRGALMNPFLPMEIKGIELTDNEKRKRLTNFHAELLNDAIQSIPQEKKCLGWMKAIWHYMSGVFSDGQAIFNRIKTTNSIAGYEETIGVALNQSFSTPVQQEQYFISTFKKR